MEILRNICRFLVGGLFVFSGFVKIVDPVGMSIKLEKYYHVFDEKLLPLPLLLTLIIPLACVALFLTNLTFFLEGHWIKWVGLLIMGVAPVVSYFAFDSSQFNNGESINYSYLSGASLFLSVLLTTLEICLGVALLTLYRIKQTSWMLLGLILFFTWLTLFTALTGQPKDCGCFGDFMKLNPWTSFGKDIILLVMIVVIFIQRDKFNSKTNNLKGAVFNLANGVFWVFFANYNLNHLPVIDFRPYKVNNDLKKVLGYDKSDKEKADSKQKVGYAVLKDGWEVLIYDDYTKPDMAHFQEPYEWIGTVPMGSGSDKEVNNFALYRSDSSGADIDVTKGLLEGKKLLFVVNELKDKDSEEFGEQIKALELGMNKLDGEVWIACADFRSKFEEFNRVVKLDGLYHMIDKDESKAVIRARSGFLLIVDGIVKGKWHINDIPEIEEIKALL